jgi:hypothetical protein
MKTKLSPLLTAFDALDLALRIAGVIGGVAAIATHLPGLHRGEPSQPPAMTVMSMDAPQPGHGHHARAATIIRVPLPTPPATPAPPMWVMTTAVE